MGSMHQQVSGVFHASGVSREHVLMQWQRLAQSALQGRMQLVLETGIARLVQRGCHHQQEHQFALKIEQFTPFQSDPFTSSLKSSSASLQLSSYEYTYPRVGYLPNGTLTSNRFFTYFFSSLSFCSLLFCVTRRAVFPLLHHSLRVGLAHLT